MAFIVFAIEMKEDLYSFLMAQRSTKLHNFLRNATFNKNEENVWFVGGTLYIFQNWNARVGMLESAPKALNFFSTTTHHHDIESKHYKS